MDKQTNIDILYNISLDRLDTQIKRIDGIDAKIGMTFGLSNGITVALVAFTAFLSPPIPLLVLVFATLTATAYIATLIVLFLAYKSGRWYFNPRLEKLRNICTNTKYKAYSEIIKKWVADECIRSFQKNRQPILDKANLADKALYALSAQGLCLIASLISYLFS